MFICVNKQSHHETVKSVTLVRIKCLNVPVIACNPNVALCKDYKDLLNVLFWFCEKM